MNTFLKRFLLWIGNGSSYWLVIIPIIISVLSVYILKPYSWGLDVFRVIGIISEIGGLLTVVLSLSRESNKYNHTGYFKSLLFWVGDFKYVFIARNITGVIASSAGFGMAGGIASISVSRNLNTIEEKVNYLMEFVTTLEKSISDNNRRIDEVKHELSGNIEKLHNTFNQEISKIQDDLKEKATVDYHLLVAGALLTILGMVMTNLPDSFFCNLLSFHVK